MNKCFQKAIELIEIGFNDGLGLLSHVFITELSFLITFILDQVYIFTNKV